MNVHKKGDVTVVRSLCVSVPLWLNLEHALTLH